MSTDDQKETAKLIRKVRRRGWTHDADSGGHNQTYLVCDGDTSGSRCTLTVYSTPKRGQPRILKRVRLPSARTVMQMLSCKNHVGNCQHPPYCGDSTGVGNTTAMPTYEFALVVDGISPEDPDHGDRLAASGADDAMVFSDGRRTIVAFYRDAVSATAALDAALAQLEHAYPDAAVCRLDRDLVSISEIADRTGVDREAVRLWVTGERRGGSFPQHVGTVSRGQHVWEWAAVYDWLVANGIPFDDGACPVPYQEAVAFDYRLAQRSGGTREIRFIGHPAAASALDPDLPPQHKRGWQVVVVKSDPVVQGGFVGTWSGTRTRVTGKVVDVESAPRVGTG